jgi:hypothetical protein
MGCNCKQELPSVVTMAVNAAGAVGRVVSAVASGASLKCSDDETERRLAICRFCTFAVPHEKKTQYLRCSKCGCWLNGKYFAKAALATERCPENKWEESK